MQTAITINYAQSAAPFAFGKDSSARAYVSLLRPQQWTKNLLVSAPLIFVGACAINVTISPWLLICTILLTLFLALSKRRGELLASDKPIAHRAVLEEYNPVFLDQLIAIVTSCTLLACILYTFSEQTMQKLPSHLMPMTLPFVLYGIFRHLYLIYRRSEGGASRNCFCLKISL